MKAQASPEVPVPITLAACYRAWVRARRDKKPSHNQLTFEAHWLERLLGLHAALRAGNWQPARTVSFVVTHPKTREIHAPDFADRVVHHVLVERLEKLFEPVFIFDSYANRHGKGIHAAVDRLQAFMRQRQNMPGNELPGGWYLQLDIHDYFNSIHRLTLYAMLCTRIAKAQQRGQLPSAHALALKSLCPKLLAQRAREVLRQPQARAQMPPHKLLRNAQAGCGLPVGNLTSQFFANVYLDALDQFVKHTLNVRHYLRYVDDFVLLGESRAQLRAWQAQIDAFLLSTLRLRCKDGAPLQPCTQGVDFLGYRVYAQHRWVRPRVVQHCRAKLQAWGREHGCGLDPARRVSAAQFSQLQALLGSYWGHFAHANRVRLRQQLFAQIPWLNEFFTLGADASLHVKAPAHWQVLRRQATRHLLTPEGETP